MLPSTLKIFSPVFHKLWHIISLLLITILWHFAEPETFYKNLFYVKFLENSSNKLLLKLLIASTINDGNYRQILIIEELFNNNWLLISNRFKTWLKEKTGHLTQYLYAEYYYIKLVLLVYNVNMFWCITLVYEELLYWSHNVLVSLSSINRKTWRYLTDLLLYRCIFKYNIFIYYFICLYTAPRFENNSSLCLYITPVSICK